MLAVDVHESFAELAQDGNGGNGAVEIHAPTPILRNDSSHQQLVIAGIPTFLQKTSNPFVVDHEYGFDAGFLGFMADQVGGRPAANDEPQRLHEQTLTRAGLASNDIEAF